MKMILQKKQKNHNVRHSFRALCMVIFMSFMTFAVHGVSLAQNVTIKLNNATLKEILLELNKSNDFEIAFSSNDLKSDKRMTISYVNEPIQKVLTECLSNTNLNYKVENGAIMVYAESSSQQNKVTVAGKVVNPKGEPIIGATVISTLNNDGAITDNGGNFSLNVPVGTEIQISFVGYVAQNIKVTKEVKDLVVKMEEDNLQVDDVTVVGGGYFKKTRYSSTSSMVHVEGEELRKVGSLNILQALSTFDPSIRTVPNNAYGSDPNYVPEITVRGENSFDLRDSADDSSTNPNSPMYILDGLEVSATRIYDLDMNRVESFDILKDASATSLYGSRGANGVIVVNTRRPEEGEVRITFSANYNVSVPDLRDYNLMNAAEKLEYERLAGVYTYSWLNGSTQDELDYEYNEKLKEVARGVDTYWLSMPLTTSVNQRYNMFIEGGDSSFRYGIDLTYDTDKGVMKGSGRDKLGATFNFNYNIKKKLYIINDLTINDVSAEDSPYGDFSEFAKQNPYERVYDENGDLIRTFEYNGATNPMVNALLPNTDYSRYTEIQDNLNLDWRISHNFRVNGTLGITKKISTAEAYRSPYSSEFDSITDIEDIGSYTSSKGTDLDVDGTITASYNTIFKNNISLSAGVGSNFLTNESVSDGYTVTGFLNDNLTYPQFAQQYEEGSTATGSYDKSRMIGFFANVNLGYENRYFIDASFRTDGSSRFGENSRFAPFWSVGLAWNVDREKWYTGDGYIKVRGSVGSTGTVNFSSSQAVTTYTYESDSYYNGIYGAVLESYGNTSLKWQNTLQYNIGVDMNVWKDIIVFNFDAYIKLTQNLLVPIDVAASTGFSSYTENMGSLENKGFDARFRVNLLQDRQRDLSWSVTVSAAHNKNKIKDISNALQAMNEAANESSQTSDVLRMYQVGQSQSALWVVQSLGIDPATGNEVYVKSDGTLTFTYDSADKIVVGDTNPTLQGTIQSNLYYKGFNLYMVFGSELGAVEYNSTLATKVEGSDPDYNADKRVLYDRWVEAGDQAMFRRIDDTSTPYQTTRLVQDSDYFTLQSLSLSYDVPTEYLKDLFVERCKITFSSTDLFRISTIKEERGTIYPFAQTFSLGLNVTF